MLRCNQNLREREDERLFWGGGGGGGVRSAFINALSEKEGEVRHYCFGAAIVLFQ